jgi:hypothetical protein
VNFRVFKGTHRCEPPGVFYAWCMDTGNARITSAQHESPGAAGNRRDIMSRFIVALVVVTSIFTIFFAAMSVAKASDPSAETMAAILAADEVADKAAAKAALAALECSDIEGGSWELPGDHDPYSWTGKAQEFFFAKAEAWAKKNCKKVKK